MIQPVVLFQDLKTPEYKYGEQAYKALKRSVIPGTKKVFLIENIIRKYIPWRGHTKRPA
jgi:hypothetical protein